MIEIIFLITISFLLSSLFLEYAIPKLKTYLLSKPKERDLHVSPTPRGAGIVFIVPSIILFFISNSGDYSSRIFVLCIPLAIVGLLDDFFNLSPRVKYFFQIITSILIINSSELINTYYLINEKTFIFNILNFLIFLFFIIFITAIINFINFMDGIDGIIGGTFIVILTYCSIKFSTDILLLVGVLLGFIRYNWHPSKVFMGDVGSTFLGAVLAGLIIRANNSNEAISLILITSPVLADAFFCVIRRFISGQNIFKPHKKHLYQRLCLAGWSQSNVATLYITGVFLLACISIFGDLILTTLAALLELSIGFVLDKRCVVKFSNKD